MEEISPENSRLPDLSSPFKGINGIESIREANPRIEIESLESLENSPVRVPEIHKRNDNEKETKRSLKFSSSGPLNIKTGQNFHNGPKTQRFKDGFLAFGQKRLRSI